MTAELGSNPNGPGLDSIRGFTISGPFIIIPFRFWKNALCIVAVRRHYHLRTCLKKNVKGLNVEIKDKKED